MEKYDVLVIGSGSGMIIARANSDILKPEKTGAELNKKGYIKETSTSKRKRNTSGRSAMPSENRCSNM